MLNFNGITVRSALTMDCFKGTKLIGGKSGLDRIITSVNVMEVPDILPWVQEGELLLTTGFSIKDDQFAQERLIPELAKKSLAGLAVKPKRYLDYVPPAMIEAADAESFPLIELPVDASHPNLLRDIYSVLVNRQAAILKKTVDVHERTMDVLLQGGGLDDIAETLSQLVDNPVVIYNSEGKELAHAGGNGGLGMFPVDLPECELRELRIKRIAFQVGEKTISGVLCPIVAASTLLGQMLIYEENGPSREIELMFMEQVSALAAIRILHQKTVRTVETKYRNELLFDWLQGGITTLDELSHRASLVGWDLGGRFVLVVIDVDEYEQLVSSDRDSANILHKSRYRVERIITRVMEHWRDYYILGERGSKFILLLRVKSTWKKQTIKQKIKEASLLLQKKFCSMEPKIQCSIGIGRQYSGLLEMKYSYQEGLKAIEIGRVIKGKGNITDFEELGIYRLLYSSERSEMDEFLHEIYFPLQHYDQEHKTELVKTLKMYFRCGGNISRIAREMYTHYNTVVYRLSRIQEIAGIDLDDPEQRLNLHVALKIALIQGQDS